MIESKNIEAAADRIWEALNKGTLCEPVRDLIGNTDLDAAYAVKLINTRRRLHRGERPVGAKIGLTSAAVQKQLGVDQPDFGALTDVMMVDHGTSLSMKQLSQPKAEAEIAFVMGRTLDDLHITMDILMDAIEAVVPAIEIVGSRIRDWDISITDTIADNASGSHFVLGEPRSDWRNLDLAACRMELWRDDELVSEGQGSACMGNPLNAALWLAQTMQRVNMPLQAGHMVLAGALGPMVAARAGDTFIAKIEGLTEVGISFSAL